MFHDAENMPTKCKSRKLNKDCIIVKCESDNGLKFWDENPLNFSRFIHTIVEVLDPVSTCDT
jgi:hypothetical protein